MLARTYRRCRARRNCAEHGGARALHATDFHALSLFQHFPDPALGSKRWSNMEDQEEIEGVRKLSVHKSLADLRLRIGHQKRKKGIRSFMNGEESRFSGNRI